LALTGELYDAIVRVVDDRVKEIRVTREMYDRLVETVASLAEAEKRTEERMGRLGAAVEGLAEAQKRTEASLSALGERATGVEVALERLAEAQKRTEERVDKLGVTVGILVEAQSRTEASITKLTEAMTEMRKEIAGLGETIGFGLEDIAHVVLPGWLARHERLRIEGLERRTVSVDERQLEFDLYGEGSKGKTHMIVLGEVKSRIHPSDVEEFTRRLKEAASVISGKVLPLMFGYWIHPAASLVAKKSRIRLIASYQR